MVSITTHHTSTNGKRQATMENNDHAAIIARSKKLMMRLTLLSWSFPWKMRFACLMSHENMARANTYGHVKSMHVHSD